MKGVPNSKIVTTMEKEFWLKSTGKKINKRNIVIK